MNSILKLAVIFGVLGIVVSCDLFIKKEYCPDDSKNLGNNLKLGAYTGLNRISILDEDNRSIFIQAKETLLLYEDSTFSYFAIAYNNESNDTIRKIFGGSFRIYQDTGFPWYVFELKSDTVYEKMKIGSTSYNYSLYDSSFRYTHFFVSRQSDIFSHYGYLENLLSDIDNSSGCFSLAYKVNPYKESFCDPDWEYCCDKMILIEKRSFCLEQNSTEDRL